MEVCMCACHQCLEDMREKRHTTIFDSTNFKKLIFKNFNAELKVF